MKGMIESKLASPGLNLSYCSWLLMDFFSAILVVVPLIIPLADKFNVDPCTSGDFLATWASATTHLHGSTSSSPALVSTAHRDLYRHGAFLLILAHSRADHLLAPDLYLPKWLLDIQFDGSQKSKMLFANP